MGRQLSMRSASKTSTIPPISVHGNQTRGKSMQHSNREAGQSKQACSNTSPSTTPPMTTTPHLTSRTTKLDTRKAKKNKGRAMHVTHQMTRKPTEK